MEYLEESILMSEDAGSTKTMLFGYQALMQLTLQMTQYLDQQSQNPSTHTVYNQDRIGYEEAIVNRQRIVLDITITNGKKALHIIDDLERGSSAPRFQQQVCLLVIPVLLT